MLPGDPADLLTHGGLLEVLDRARRLGFTGDAAPEEQIAHALRFASALSEAFTGEGPGSDGVIPAGFTGVDLGSGAGLPGLVLAIAFPESRWILVEAMVRRSGPLAEAIDRLDLGTRVEVWQGRAEAFGQQPGRRGFADVVTARGFAAPAVTAECAAPLLRPGGLLAVSEPPESDGSRWPGEGLRELGLTPHGVVEGVMVCESMGVCPALYPRRVGLPAKRPLF